MNWYRWTVRKLVAGVVAMVLGSVFLAAVVFGELGAGLPDTQYALAALGGMATTALGFAFMWISIRCPSCGLRLFASAAGRSPAGTTLIGVLALHACPRCGQELGPGLDSRG